MIGVPVKSRALNGLDSLLSIVQMPAGVPVATTAINGAKNAALIAVSILALRDEELAARLDALPCGPDGRRAEGGVVALRPPGPGTGEVCAGTGCCVTYGKPIAARDP